MPNPASLIRREFKIVSNQYLMATKAAAVKLVKLLDRLMNRTEEVSYLYLHSPPLIKTTHY